MPQVRAAWLVVCLLGCGGGSASDDGNEAADGSVAVPVTAAGKQADAARPSGPEPDAAVAATFTQIYAALFPATTPARCNFCHSMPASDTSNGLLSVGTTQAAAYAALVGKVARGSQCSGMPLVVPGDPEASLFLLKFSEAPPCGSRMPLGGSVLSAALLEQVRSWIAAGAKND
ncbi:MAG: hypothetical protein JWN48_128 [Myxococcaceae bacterium]|nr:hypothetical protein [Myxococcaceae bacterium]